MAALWVVKAAYSTITCPGWPSRLNVYHKSMIPTPALHWENQKKDNPKHSTVDYGKNDIVVDFHFDLGSDLWGSTLYKVQLRDSRWSLKHT
ncbi:hypothetical protein FKM82_016761 [Ascaphus truei]